jgi:non-specific serine/threonine protein kinase
MNAGKRKIEISTFQENEDYKVFLLSLKAGGVGINLTSADYVILFDPWWNPAVESQAVDRLHRIGQTRKVLAYKMVVKDTVEEKMLALQERKKKLVSELITTESGFFKSLSKEDVVRLFEAV